MHRRAPRAAVIALLFTALLGTGCGKEQEELVERGREGGAVAQVQAALTAAALAQQTHHAAQGTYTQDLGALTDDGGLRVPQGVTLTVVRADASGYCVEASHPDAPAYHLASGEGTPKEGPC